MVDSARRLRFSKDTRESGCKNRSGNVTERERTGNHVLIIVQNLPVPFDRRVWLECQALRSVGYEVSVVCPKAPGDPPVEVIEEFMLYKYRPYQPGGGGVGFLIEYVYSFVAKPPGVPLEHGEVVAFRYCRPAIPPISSGHSACSFGCFGLQLFCSSTTTTCVPAVPVPFPRRSPVALLGAEDVLEWCTFRSANHVTSTNESYRHVALTRGGKHGHEVTVVRTGPDEKRLKRETADPLLRRGRRFLVRTSWCHGPPGRS